MGTGGCQSATLPAEFRSFLTTRAWMRVERPAQLFDQGVVWGDAGCHHQGVADISGDDAFERFSVLMATKFTGRRCARRPRTGCAPCPRSLRDPTTHSMASTIERFRLHNGSFGQD
jgi:hypothetical protein